MSTPGPIIWDQYDRINEWFRDIGTAVLVEYNSSCTPYLTRCGTTISVTIDEIGNVAFETIEVTYFESSYRKTQVLIFESIRIEVGCVS